MTEFKVFTITHFNSFVNKKIHKKCTKLFKNFTQFDTLNLYTLFNIAYIII